MVSKLLIKFLNPKVRNLNAYIENSRDITALKERIIDDLKLRSEEVSEGTDEERAADLTVTIKELLLVYK